MRTLQRYLCVSRPRRFGKSMAADMLAAYYDRSTDTDALFQNLKIGRSETYKKHRNQYDVIKINMQEFLSATSGIDEMLRMLNDYLIFDLREQYSQVRFRDEKNLVQVMKDLTYDNEKENVSIPNREVSQEYINAISRFPFCNTTMKARCEEYFYHYSRFLRVPCDLGVHDFRVFPYHYVTVSAVYRFVDNYRCGGDPVFPAWL
ncbi:AAA family ATPase [Blautia sp. AF34-10]|uniref:AAA family ATPase n=1 Tax=Blautia sp. AF34-10 TaxID=2292968 RepID=UPI002E8E42D3|nr:AAA family ATPase [Blautia sp. AF34-10]